MIDKKSTYAVIGASNNPSKYGHIVLKDLKESGYRVVPINPKAGEILGLKAYPDILSAPKPIDVAVFVVPPAVTVKVLIDAKKAGIKKAWFQPGSASEVAIVFCRDNDIDQVNDACIMTEKKIVVSKKNAIISLFFVGVKIYLLR